MDDQVWARGLGVGWPASAVLGGMMPLQYQCEES
jgi:hypothetical protein